MVQVSGYEHEPEPLQTITKPAYNGHVLVWSAVAKERGPPPTAEKVASGRNYHERRDKLWLKV